MQKKTLVAICCVAQAPSVEEDEIARSEDEVNANTKVLMYDYGTFVKKQ